MHLSVVYQRIAFYDYFNNFPWGTMLCASHLTFSFRILREGFAGPYLR